VTLRLPDPCLVVLVGATGAGKSAWARAWFDADCVVSSDRLRGVVGAGERDQRASRDAFELLDLIVAKRLARGLTTVVDTTGLEAKRRAGWLALAADASVPAYAVTFDVPEKVVRERNRARGAPVPPKVVAAQLREAAEVFGALAGEGFAGVAAAAPVELVPPAFLSAPAAAARQADAPLPLAFGLQVSRFGWEGSTARTLADVARAAEEAGFTSLWLMDHFLQIPQVGREWEDMLESYTTLGYLAGVTSTIRLGTLVTGVTYRNLAHLAKVVATLDVVSEGRALCGIGAGWFEREHKLYGWEFPPLRERYERLEDALELLPLMWGPGAPRFEGRTTTVAEATCYPRPLQERIPILVGGSGERRTLRLVARHADACNLFGDAATVRRKLDVLRSWCETESRDPSAIAVTHLAPARVVAAGEPREGQGAATVEEHVGRYRELAEAGVQTAIVGLSDAVGPESVTRFADVVAAFR
jgi:F420-dependent oxidoreductase-like protein